ncbi:hypothetical protein Lesp02_05680 [Lentzea sp. NBRC 105346]|uniref:NB-ARC domain-containing protein n=1 Tax=Lentzea sp. NBRC 105346 TaxID=3032205 RepID=UPI0024A0FFAB|nr:NB-ARC domain-containing protein [Lentzea sp. NBRC 105346]GLZ28378.1 hypothetical protein Lesp02_05680 [Lentzea sp. NBRC 105346]
MASQPVEHRTILAVDIEGFGSPQRSDADQVALRSGMYRAFRAALSNSGLEWADCHVEDRGDGVLALLPPTMPKASVVDTLPSQLIAAIDRHNSTHTPEARIRMRVAVHAGEVHHDDHGVVGSSVNFVFRILDSAALKSALATSAAPLGLVVSPWFYDEVVRHSAALDADEYRRIEVNVKETTIGAWIRLPGIPQDRRTTVVPRQLPAYTPHFVGRNEELRALADTDANTVIVSSIDGTAGVGKTALALLWAHQAADRFPDGQLYVDLCGFDRSAEPVASSDALDGFLDALGLPIPADPEEARSLYRRTQADRRMLVVLDNARDAAQVRPLLATAPGCLTVVTSRSRLDPLVVREGARRINLGTLRPDEAAALLGRYLGPGRVAAERRAATAIIDSCGHLPLALTIAAAHAATRPDLTLEQVAAELRAERQRIEDLMFDSDPVKPAVSWVCRALSPEAARVYQLLAQQAGAEFGTPIAAGLAGTSEAETAAILSGLSRARLVEEHAPGRYRFHDLVRRSALEVRLSP